jgi:AcrR family transcriptional regulator
MPLEVAKPVRRVRPARTGSLKSARYAWVRRRSAMPNPSRRDQARLAARQTIMEEARTLFVAKGYEAVTMRDIARATQYTASALYYHFKDKAELMMAICSEDFLKLAQVFRSALVHENPLENIKSMELAYARFALANPNHCRLMFMSKGAVSLKMESSLQQGDPNQDAYAALHHLVNLAHQQGLLLEGIDDTHLVAQTFWGRPARHGVPGAGQGRRGVDPLGRPRTTGGAHDPNPPPRSPKTLNHHLLP